MISDTRDIKGIDYVESCLVQLLTLLGDVHILIAGDFNARTGSLDDFIMQDDDETDMYLHILNDMEYNKDSFHSPRISRDKEVNDYGKDMINLCCTYGIHMLNGRFSDDPHGSCTCFSSNGASLVDYILCLSQLIILRCILVQIQIIFLFHVPSVVSSIVLMT